MISGIIYGAGFSRRMKRDKLLIEVEGVKIIERVIRACASSKLDRLILVYRKDEIREIGEEYGLTTVYNPRAHLGQSETMKLGIREAGEEGAYMFIVGDQPYLNKDIINQLIDKYEETRAGIIIPYYRGERGMPMIMSSKYREELLKVEGDKGGRDVVRRHEEDLEILHLDKNLEGRDVDKEEDLKSL